MGEHDRFPTTLRAAARGGIAAMAMTGMRRVTTGLGLVGQTPPEEIATEGFPGLFARIPVQHRDEAVELAHWSYGAFAGAAFGLLPRSLRASPWAGPAYGLAIWAGFEAGLAPLLGLRDSGQRTLRERVSIAADHVLYGAIVAGTPWPHRT